MNMLSNAIKYTPGGDDQPAAAELPSIIENKGQFEFVFADNGIGMPQEFLPHIFEPFTGPRIPGSARSRARALAWPSPRISCA